MAEFLLMPCVIANASDGTIARWLKTEGDPVKAGEAFAEIETDKAVIEIPSPKAGHIARILHGDGATVAVEAPIGVIADEGEGDDAVARLLASVATTPPPSRQSAREETVPVAAAEAADRDAGTRIFASPLARRLAREAAISLADVGGTGPHGRIMRGDVEAFVLSAVPAGTASEPVDSKPEVTRAGTAVDALDVGIPHLSVPHSAMRRTIAQRLSEAKRTIPHFYLNADIAVDALLDLRARINADRPSDRRISVTDFIVKASATAFDLVPACNVIWTEAALLDLQRTDICVAVATDGGLVTPVVKDAGNKSLSALSDEISELALKARSGKLKPEEYRGGSFTISNLGMYGVSDFTAIVNPPQAAILAVGAIEERIVSRDGIAASARMMRVTLSLDHRAIDGAVGAQWLSNFKELVQNPMRILV